jgi:hypothetical protein
MRNPERTKKSITPKRPQWKARWIIARSGKKWEIRTAAVASALRPSRAG